MNEEQNFTKNPEFEDFSKNKSVLRFNKDKFWNKLNLLFQKARFKRLAFILSSIVIVISGFSIYKYYSIYNSKEFIISSAVKNFSNYRYYNFEGNIKADFIDSNPDKQDSLDLEYINLPNDNFTQAHELDLSGRFETSKSVKFESEITWNKNKQNEVVLGVVVSEGNLYWKINKFFDEGLVGSDVLNNYLKIDLKKVESALGFSVSMQKITEMIDPKNIETVESLPVDVINNTPNFHYRIKFTKDNYPEHFRVDNIDLWISKNNREISKLKTNIFIDNFGSESKYVGVLLDINIFGQESIEREIGTPQNTIEIN